MGAVGDGDGDGCPDGLAEAEAVPEGLGDVSISGWSLAIRWNSSFAAGLSHSTADSPVGVR